MDYIKLILIVCGFLVAVVVLTPLVFKFVDVLKARRFRTPTQWSDVELDHKPQP